MPTLTIRPAYRELLHDAGLDSYEALLRYRGPDEDVTAIHPTRRVYRIEIGGGEGAEGGEGRGVSFATRRTAEIPTIYPIICHPEEGFSPTKDLSKPAAFVSA